MMSCSSIAMHYAARRLSHCLYDVISLKTNDNNNILHSSPHCHYNHYEYSQNHISVSTKYQLSCLTVSLLFFLFAVSPSKPQITDGAGTKLHGVIGPFYVGHSLRLNCLVEKGKSTECNRRFEDMSS